MILLLQKERVMRQLTGKGKYYKSVAELNHVEHQYQRQLPKYAKYLDSLSQGGVKERLINNGSYSYRKTKQKMTS